MPWSVPSIESEIVTLSLSTPPLAITFTNHQGRIDATQDWVTDCQEMKSLMFLEAFNSLLKWKEN